MSQDQGGPALQTNLFDSGLKRAAGSNPLVTEPVDSVSVGEGRKSSSCLNRLL